VSGCNGVQQHSSVDGGRETEGLAFVVGGHQTAGRERNGCRRAGDFSGLQVAGGQQAEIPVVRSHGDEQDFGIIDDGNGIPEGVGIGLWGPRTHDTLLPAVIEQSPRGDSGRKVTGDNGPSTGRKGHTDYLCGC
ncbi:MAG: hypothetical protein ACK559_28745, partial [bacterium]